MNCFIIYSSFWNCYSGIYDDEEYSLEERIRNYVPLGTKFSYK